MLSEPVLRAIVDFYRDASTSPRSEQLYGKRIAIRIPGSGTHALVTQLFATQGLITASGKGSGYTDLVELGGADALQHQGGEDRCCLYVGGADTPTIQAGPARPL